MAKPNYSFAKRQRDLAKEHKKEEKLQRKNAAQAEPTSEEPTEAVDGETPDSETPTDETPKD